MKEDKEEFDFKAFAQQTGDALRSGKGSSSNPVLKARSLIAQLFKAGVKR